VLSITFFLKAQKVLSGITVQVNKACRKTLPDVPLYNIAQLARKDDKKVTSMHVMEVLHFIKAGSVEHSLLLEQTTWKCLRAKELDAKLLYYSR
jgi:hypothetical protein